MLKKFIKKKAVDLASFVSGIVRALTVGQQALPKARSEQISQHFKKDSDGRYIPIKQTFEIDENTEVEIPTYCLSRINHIGIESAKIMVSAKIVEVDEEEYDCDLSCHNTEVRFAVKPAQKDNKSFEIEIHFSKNQTCEADLKLLEFLDNTVEVKNAFQEQRSKSMDVRDASEDGKKMARTHSQGDKITKEGEEK